MHPLWQLTLARWRELYREPGVMFWVFGFPVLLAAGLGIAFKEKPAPTPRVAVVEGVPWLEQALAGPALERVVLDEADAHEALRRGKVDVVVAAVPGDTPRVAYRFDPANDQSRFARLIVDGVVQRALGREDAIAAQDEQVSEPGSRYIDFLVPGLLGLNLMSSSLWGIAYALVLSRKRKQLKRLAATPMRRSHFLLSYLLSRSALLVAEVLSLLLVGWLLFDVIVRGSWLAFGVLTLLGAAAFAGVGMMIAARITSTEVAGGWLNFVMLPMWLLSGSFFSYERFPEWSHALIEWLPLTALNDGLRAVMNDGAGLLDVGFELAVLTVWGALGFALALGRFRWQ